MREGPATTLERRKSQELGALCAYPTAAVGAIAGVVDQRGYVRPDTGDANCSIGAYEYTSPGPPANCVGDCTGDGAVTVDELITMVNIGLGSANVLSCEAGDVDTDGAINIAEITTAMKVALGDCSMLPPPTATPNVARQ